MLEAGELLAFAISEKEHGADLLGNQFRVREVGPGRLVASGSKYYIGNCNCAGIVTALRRRVKRVGVRGPVLVALRPGVSPLSNVRKFHTLGCGRRSWDRLR